MRDSGNTPTEAKNVPSEANRSGTRRPCVAVILNPVSGKHDPNARRQDIEAAFDAIGLDCIHFETTPDVGATTHARAALATQLDFVAVSGGDGTVVEVMAALRESHTSLIVLPSGTGNLLAHNLGIPLELSRAVRAAVSGNAKQIDLARLILSNAREVVFAVVAGAGFDAGVIRDADRESKNRLGLFAYLVAAAKNLYRRPVRARLYLDGASTVTLQQRVRSVMVANMGRLQAGLPLAPDARPDDGILDIVLLKTENFGDWARLLWSVVRHQTHTDPAMEFHKCSSLRVELSRPQPVQYDGEELGEPVTGFSVEIIPRAVSVLLPSNDDATDR